MRVAHVRERHAPAGAPWRLAVAADGEVAADAVAAADEAADEGAVRWIDLEVSRRRLVRRDPRLAHNDPLFRRPVTTLDDHLEAGLRVNDLRALVEPLVSAEAASAPEAGDDGDLLLETPDLRFG